MLALFLKGKSYIFYFFYILKVTGPISQNADIYSNDASSPKKYWFQIPVKSLNRVDARTDYVFCNCLYLIVYSVSLIMVTITSHIFMNIFKTVHFSAVKFTSGNEKNMSFLLVPESPKVWNKSEAIGPGTLSRMSPMSASPGLKWDWVLDMVEKGYIAFTNWKWHVKTTFCHMLKMFYEKQWVPYNNWM